MTRLQHERPYRETDPARKVRDPREGRQQRTLDELIQLAAIYEPSARRVQERIEAGASIYPFEQVQLDDWHRIVAEIEQLQSFRLPSSRT
jgi:hypothetical protein